MIMNTEKGPPSVTTTKVFYDGQCPLCRREIHHYQQMKSISGIEWINISGNNAVNEEYGLSREKAMARFHVLDAQGCWHVGAYGFVEMWSQLSAMRWLAFALKKLRLLPFADWLYSWFARWRLKKRCSGTACTY